MQKPPAGGVSHQNSLFQPDAFTKHNQLLTMDNQIQTQPQTQPSTVQNQPAANAPRRYVRPRANIVETAGSYVVQVELPGVTKTGLELTFENGELTLVGHRATAADPGKLLYRESRPMDFRRVFELDSSVDASQISARFEQGLATLTLPKAEAAKPRRIEVGGLN
jgi:HSP20 family protein